MNWHNSKQYWGLISIIIHWLTAITVIALFIIGLWMVELTYYDDWYCTAPHLHKSIGLLIFFLTILRITWLKLTTKPAQLKSHSPLEHLLAKIVHWTLYILLFSLMISGYLISTADGRPIELFNWFEIPAVLSGITGSGF